MQFFRGEERTLCSDSCIKKKKKQTAVELNTLYPVSHLDVNTECDASRMIHQKTIIFKNTDGTGHVKTHYISKPG